MKPHKKEERTAYALREKSQHGSANEFIYGFFFFPIQIRRIDWKRRNYKRGSLPLFNLKEKKNKKTKSENAFKHLVKSDLSNNKMSTYIHTFRNLHSFPFGYKKQLELNIINNTWESFKARIEYVIM